MSHPYNRDGPMGAPTTRSRLVPSGSGQWGDDDNHHGMRGPNPSTSSRIGQSGMALGRSDPRTHQLPPAPIRDPRQARHQMPPPRPPASLPPTSKKQNANDCEIIVMSKQQQGYAELVEKTIKDLGLKVDLMFPKPDISIQTFIENIASMGAYFAVVIRTDNENHKSLSVHVLKGVPKPEEHRNMPLAAAFSLVKERYNQIRRADFGVICSKYRDHVNMLLDSHYLTDAEYKYIVQYTHERWAKQRVLENKTEYDSETGMSSVQQIQEKIVKVLGLKAGKRVPPGQKQHTQQQSTNNLMRQELPGTSHSQPRYF